VMFVIMVVVMFVIMVVVMFVIMVVVMGHLHSPLISVTNGKRYAYR